MVRGQADLDHGAGRGFEHGAFRARDAQVVHGEPERLGLAGDIDLQAVVLLDRPGRLEPQPRLAGAVAEHALGLPGRRAAVADPVGIGHVEVLPRLEEEAGPWPAEDGLDVGLVARAFGGREGAVDQFPVVVGRRGDVERALHPALDLERGDAGVAQGPDLVRQGEVFHGEQKAAFGGNVQHRTSNVERRTTVRTPWTANRELIPAHVRTAAAVAAAAEDVGGEEAQAAVGVAERAVDEGLGLDVGHGGDDLADLVQRQLARERDAGEPEVAQGLDALPVVNGHLRAGVEPELREVLVDSSKDAQVLDDHGVHADVGHGREQLHQGLQLVLQDQRVDGGEHLAAGLERVGVGGDRVRLLEREVGRLGAGGEALEAEVDGVRPVVERRAGGIGAAGGRHQLGAPVSRRRHGSEGIAEMGNGKWGMRSEAEPMARFRAAMQ